MVCSDSDPYLTEKSDPDTKSLVILVQNDCPIVLSKNKYLCIDFPVQKRKLILLGCTVPGLFVSWVRVVDPNPCLLDGGVGPGLLKLDIELNCCQTGNVDGCLIVQLKLQIHVKMPRQYLIECIKP